MKPNRSRGSGSVFPSAVPCIAESQNTHTHTHTHTHIHAPTHTHTHTCICIVDSQSTHVDKPKWRLSAGLFPAQGRCALCARLQKKDNEHTVLMDAQLYVCTCVLWVGECGCGCMYDEHTVMDAPNCVRVCMWVGECGCGCGCVYVCVCISCLCVCVLARWLSVSRMFRVKVANEKLAAQIDLILMSDTHFPNGPCSACLRTKCNLWTSAFTGETGSTLSVH